jgi:hypothetical protein
MTLDARRIALQGIGGAALFVALQGFAPVVISVEEAPPVIEVPRGGGIAWQLSRRKKIEEDEALLIAVLI